MKEYKVTYGGLPESSKKITAASANEAAKEFFLANPEKKHIFVNVNMFKEEIFKWTDFEGIESPFDEPKSTERISEGYHQLKQVASSLSTESRLGLTLPHQHESRHL